MLCTTNIWIKIQKCAIPHKNLYFLPTFVPENSSQETKKMALSETLYGKTPEQLAAVCAELGMPRFAAKQLARWIYAKHVEDPMRMSDIAAAHRAKLAERFRPAFTPPARITESADGTKKNLYRIARKGTTIPHENVGKFGASMVVLKPAAPGTGVIAGGAVRAVVEAAGIKDIRTKCLRSNNPNNVVAAAFEGLKSMRGPEEVARIRGKSVEEIVG